MLDTRYLTGCIDTPRLHLAWSEAPWDSAVFGYSVLQIDRLECRSPEALHDITPFILARDRIDCGLVSCRLNHQLLKESIFLEDVGFRFIEMLYQPEFIDLQAASHLGDNQDLDIDIATLSDLSEILHIARKAYGNERIHMDPRLPSAIGDIRYQNWVKNTFKHPTQRTYVLRDGEKLVAFFIIENLASGRCYWHLNAVNPVLQGNGYGLRAWRAMLDHARKNGSSSVQTSIVARNHRVLNLYARLGFYFPPPLMTLHWVRQA